MRAQVVFENLRTNTAIHFMRFSDTIGRLKTLCGLIVGVALTLAPIDGVRAESVDNKTTHLMAIGICPPWKRVDTQACRRSVDAIEAALAERLGIDKQNVTTLVNAPATTEGLRAAFARLSGLGANDRLIIYANLHAGALDPAAETGPGNDVFVLWTEEKPVALPFAVAEGDWIMASDFAGWVHDLAAGEVIFILDACESDAVTPLFIEAHPQNNANRAEAVIVSAAASQFANFAADRSIALYSQQLAQSIADGRGTFQQAADLAASRTHTAAIPICDLQKSALEQAGMDPQSCAQQPTTHDPDALLTRIVLHD
ncbi:MAG TPA: hypothetical protein VL017_11395 [Devosia sp.]|nr:hypothetical protein [Devosia sp.]